ncbi:MAG: PD-(D/E)XK nuclease family protein [Anaerolineae bacterium]
MSVELLCAPPAGGKTRACLQRIQTVRAGNPLAVIRVVVPDRIQVAAFRRRLAGSGGALGVAAGTFGDLYREILQRAGRIVPLISAPLAQRLVQEAAAQAAEAGELRHYARIQTFPGFHQALGEAFAELKRAMVEPGTLSGYAAGGSQAQQELALIYTRYQTRLQELSWADQEGYSWLAVAALQENPRLACCYELLIIDGFDTFNRAQRRALKGLAGQVSSLLITLPLTLGTERTVERRSVQVYQRLAAEIDLTVTSLGTAPHLPAEIGHVQTALFTGRGQRLARAEHIEMLQARSKDEEAREALRWLKARVRRDKIALADCLLFVPDLPTYRPYLGAAGREFGIPLTFSAPENLARSPAMAALLSLLDLPVVNYKTRQLLGALHSPFFQLGLTDEHLVQLEQISQVAQVVEGIDQWQETWQRLSSAQPDNPNLDEAELDLPDLPHGAQAADLQQALDQVFAVLTPPPGECSLHAWVAWLENLVELTGFARQLKDFYIRQASEPARDNDEQEPAEYTALIEVLRALVASETVAGEQSVPYIDFIAQLKLLLTSTPLAESRPPNQETLLVGSILEARGVRCQAAAILGLSEGIFPVIERPDPLLDENLRRELELEPRLEREQAGLFYQALARADKRLLLTRPYLAEGGEAWEESPYWLEVKNHLPVGAVRTVRPDDPRPLTEAASPQELLFMAVRRGSLPAGYSELAEGFAGLRQARKVLRARRASQPQSSYEGDLGTITGTLTQGQRTWSASRLETYGTCPFYYYVNNVLKLEPIQAPTAGLDAARYGTILHRILERTYASAADPTSLEALTASLAVEAPQVLESAPRKYGFRPGVLWQAEQAQLVEVLANTIAALHEMSTSYQPLAFELHFGMDGRPPLRINLESGSASFHGVIDRIDRHQDGTLRIIDYKTGSSHMSLTDLLSGRRLQLPLYALAAREIYGKDAPLEGWYWQIQAAKPASLKLSTVRSPLGQGFAGAERELLAHLERILGGIRTGAFIPGPPSGGCPAYCPAAGWCWRYEAAGW